MLQDSGEEKNRTCF